MRGESYRLFPITGHNHMNTKEWTERHRHWKSGWFAPVIAALVIVYWVILMIYVVFRGVRKRE